METLPEPAGVITYAPARIPHYESLNFALDYLGLEDKEPEIVVDWFFPIDAGMVWVALVRCEGVIFLFRQDVKKHLGMGQRKYTTPLVRVVEGAEWVALASWPRVSPNIDTDTIQQIRDFLGDEGEWVDLVAWYKEVSSEAEVL